MKNLNIIFIGGTGRSGTTLLARIFGKHPDIYAFPTEIRFITDPDGLLSLKNALVDNWSFFQADFAIDRFYKLMRNLSTRYIGRYPNSNLKAIVGDNFYKNWVNSYLGALCKFSFKSAWAARATLYRKGLLHFLGRNKVVESFLETSYYCSPLSENKFYLLTNTFLNDFFNQAAHIHGGKIVVEHTPSNLIHADFLNKVLPGMKLIHIYRDPRDVIASYSTKDWGSIDKKINLKWISDILNRWEIIKSKIPESSYYELSFEDLIHNFKSVIRDLCEFLHIQFCDCMVNVDISHHNIGRWKKDLNNIEKKYFFDNYSYLLKRYGYR